MYALAQRYAMAGDVKAALGPLGDAIRQQPKVYIPQAAADPVFEKMRTLPEFKKLVQ
jgi:Tfp pilus assembly protein PilF